MAVILHFYQYFAKLYSHESNVLKKEIANTMLSTDSKFFAAEVVERLGDLYTLFPKDVGMRCTQCMIFKCNVLSTHISQNNCVCRDL